MDLTSNNTHTLDSDTKTPPPTQPTNTNTLKSLSLTNGTHNNNHHRHQSTTRPSPPSMAVISYKECLKNHAASIGGHALDGCGEFMPSSSTNPTDPRSLKCAACGCHRNFHRRDPPEPNNFSPVVLNANSGGSNSNSSKNKRYRTKFSQEQKEKMYRFSEKLGWRMNNKGDDSLVQEFCNDIGVPRGVFKVWMHNNKNTFNKKRSSSSEPPLPPPAAAGNNHINDHDQKINATAAADGSNNNKNGDINNVVSHVPINALSS
ncbi:hypothetical protein Ahy_A03g010894 isoform B [Arachis hypogaea]|uniref:ZF-HD dimerization-type domain-containing protein n=1 Tax=Arachis hypogaea TaxID=3818 RepID=A0A445DNW2_ARAHY|nr:hypothetical protein Ahy_A03g010894 isoform B [Arachis hypogaea]